MVGQKYFWYIPANNEIVQEHGTFSCTGLFDSRSTAIEYIQQAELSRSPDEVYLIEANIQEREEAAVHVGHDWNVSETDADDSMTDSREDVHESSSEDGDRSQDWNAQTTTENIEFLLDQFRSGEIEVQTEVVSTLQARVGDEDVVLDQDDATDLCSVLTETRSEWDNECKAAADAVIADISESYPASIENTVDTLVRDLDDALTKSVEDHPGYGLVKIPEYGEPAAIALSHYAAWRGSAPQSFVETVAHPGRRKRADFLISSIVEVYPGFIEDLHNYSCDNKDSRQTIYRLLGVIAGGENEVSDQAWEMLLDDLQTSHKRELYPILLGIRRTTLSHPERVDDVTQFLDILQDDRMDKQVQSEISRILANIVEERSEFGNELWEYLSADDEHRIRVQAVIADALANTLGDEAPYLSNPEQLVSLLQSKPSIVAKPLSSLLVTAFEDEPRKLADTVPELQEMIHSTNDNKIRVNLLKVLLPVAKDSPETINIEEILPLVEHESNEVREYACDIIGYAGSPTAYEVLQEVRQEDPSEKVQHTASHAITRLEARYPGQFDNK